MLAISLGAFFMYSPVTAGGVTITLTPSSSSSSPQEVAITWTSSPSAGYTSGSTVTIQSDTAFTSLAQCSTPTTDLDGNGTTDGSVTGTSTTILTYTLTNHTTSTSNSLCVELTFPSTALNYGISMAANTSTGGLIDFGAALFYANGGNQVTVTMDVNANLSFSIKNEADSALVNTCDLSTLTSAATSTCNYRLRIATNAESGFQAQVVADQELGTGSATMTTVTNDGGGFTPGTEAYGFGRIVGATEGGRNTTTLAFTEPVVEDATTNFTFQTDPSPVPTSTATNIISYGAQFQTGNAPSTTSTTLVEHEAAISNGTAAGNYTQVLTYTVTATF